MYITKEKLPSIPCIFQTTHKSQVTSHSQHLYRENKSRACTRSSINSTLKRKKLFLDIPSNN